MRVTNTIALGVDVIRISRFGDMIHKRGIDSLFVDKLSSRILHNTHELPAFRGLIGKNDFSGSIRYLAGNWAMKEAIYKTLDPEDQGQFLFNQWFKLYDERGKPTISNEEYHKQRKEEEFLLSISHDEDVLMASVLRQEVRFLGPVGPGQWDRRDAGLA